MEMDTNNTKEIIANLNKNIISWYPIKENNTVLQIGENKHIFEELKTKTNAVDSISEKDLKTIQKKYNFVVLIGCFEKLNTELEIVELLQTAQNCLTNDGKILLVMQNKFGMKYWTGEKISEKASPYESLVQHTENILSLPKIKTILNNLQLKYKFYYPLPDYKITNVIYTDEFMPDDESIDSRILTFCNNDEILNFSEREAYKQLIKEDKKLFPFFSNSYFIEISKKENFENIKFVSFGNLRKEEYQIKTIIGKENVFKYANSEKSQSHIDKMQKILEILKETKIDYIGSYVDGHIETKFLKNAKSLDKLLFGLYNEDGIEKTIEIIEDFKTNILDKLLQKPGTSQNDIFEKYHVNIDSKIKEEFHYTQFGVIDLIFQNFLVENDIIYAYDQEWIEENTPIEFILYRAILYFSEIKNQEDIKLIYEKLGLTKYITYFKELDEKIQDNIKNQEFWNEYIEIAQNIGKYNVRDLLNEQKSTAEHIKNLEQNLDVSNKAIEEYQEDVKNLQDAVEVYQENVQSLQNAVEEYREHLALSENHIKNLEQNLTNCQKDIEEKSKTIEDYSLGIQGLRKGIDDLTLSIQEKDAQIMDYANQLRTISNSLSWKITKPIRIASWALNPFNRSKFY